MTRRGPRSADELMVELEADPAWVAARDAREAELAATEANYREAEAPLVAALAEAGLQVSSVWDLVNTKDVPTAGQAIPSYAPQVSGQYFHKLECFCFEQQELAGGETRKFPVVFVVDPKLPKDVNTITLSYTFFEVAGRGAAAAQVTGEGRGG